MSMDHLDCEKHGKSRLAFVCSHLTSGEKQGWWEPTHRNPDPDDAFDGCLNAWCSVCEAIRREHAGWNEESGHLAQIVAVCEQCALEIKAKNTE